MLAFSVTRCLGVELCGRCWGVGCWGIGLCLACFTEADDVGVLGVGVLDFSLSVSQRRTMLGC